MTDGGRMSPDVSEAAEKAVFPGYKSAVMPGWTLGDVIRHHRKAKGPRWTQTFLGEQCRPRCNKDQIVRAENDRPVENGTLERIATALGTTIDALLTEVTAPGKPAPGVGNSTVDLPIRTRHTQDIPQGRSERTSGEEEENIEMQHADSMAIMACLLGMGAGQIREVRHFAEYIQARDRRESSSGKARG